MEEIENSNSMRYIGGTYTKEKKCQKFSIFIAQLFLDVFEFIKLNLILLIYSQRAHPKADWCLGPQQNPFWIAEFNA